MFHKLNVLGMNDDLWGRFHGLGSDLIDTDTYYM